MSATTPSAALPARPMLYIQRIFWPQVADQPTRDRTLAFLQRHRALCHEISFFTEGDGTDRRWLAPEEIAHRAGEMACAIGQARALGFTTAVNVLNTLGHSDDVEPGTILPTWRRMVGHDGSESLISPCPQDPAFLGYVRLKYRAYAAGGAERYWIDDDIRLHNHGPVGRGCYCPVCLDSMAHRLGRPLDRSALASAVDADPGVQPLWRIHEQAVLGQVIDAAVNGIRDVAPAAEIGLMTCDPREMGHGDWIGRLRSGGRRPWIRPGGGCWNDDEARGALRKAGWAGAQCDGLAGDVGIAYEVENYPYAIGAKSAAMTGWECLLATISGRLDGIMFNILDGVGNDLDAYDAWMRRLAAWTPLIDLAAAAVAGTVVTGWSFVGGPGPEMTAAQMAGLPVAHERSGTQGWILTEAAARRCNVGELQELFALPVIMDGGAASRCLELGLGDLLGITTAASHRHAVHEVFGDHPCNGADRGFVRGFTNGYFALTSHAFVLRPGATALSRLVSSRGHDLGAAATLHAVPGKSAVAVLGHAPWTHVLSPARIRQLGRLAAAMLGPVARIRIDTGDAVVLWTRSGGGRDLAVLANSRSDPAEILCAHLSGSAPGELVCSPGVEVVAAGSASHRVTLPPWSAVLVAWPGTRVTQPPGTT